MQEHPQDFGDLTLARTGTSGAASPTRGVFAGGQNPDGKHNTIDYIEFASTGNAKDFGDLDQARSYGYGGMSNGHGGL